MTSSLTWCPSVVPTQQTLPYELKFVLRKKYGNPVEAVFTTHDISYLEGLRDCEIKGAMELIQAIAEHGSIQVKEFF